MIFFAEQPCVACAAVKDVQQYPKGQELDINHKEFMALSYSTVALKASSGVCWPFLLSRFRTNSQSLLESRFGTNLRLNYAIRSSSSNRCA